MARAASVPTSSGGVTHLVITIPTPSATRPAANVVYPSEASTPLAVTRWPPPDTVAQSRKVPTQRRSPPDSARSPPTGRRFLASESFMGFHRSGTGRVILPSRHEAVEPIGLLSWNTPVSRQDRRSASADHRAPAVSLGDTPLCARS